MVPNDIVFLLFNDPLFLQFSLVTSAAAADTSGLRTFDQSNAPAQQGYQQENNCRSPEAAGAASESGIEPDAEFARLVQLSNPLVRLLLRPFLRIAIGLLQPAYELLALPLDDIQLIVGEVTPGLLGLAFELLPITLYLLPIHGTASCFEMVGDIRVPGRSRVLAIRIKSRAGTGLAVNSPYSSIR
jgi:hypothetical protein